MTDRTIPESAAAAAIRDAYPEEAWAISRVPSSSGRVFRAATDRRAVVIKFGARPAVLGRLASLGVTPPVLAGGDSPAGGYTIQEQVEGRSVDGRWVEEHFHHVARLIRLVHGDAALRELAEPLSPDRFLDLLGERLAVLFAQPAGRVDQTPRRTADRVRLRLAAAMPVPAPSVATHGDPNTENLLLAGDRLFLLDWDELRLADAYRDLGQALWWYVRPERWADCAALCGYTLDAPALARLAWWAGAESLEVAITLMERGDPNADAFLEDAEAAVAGRPNPRAWWLPRRPDEQRSRAARRSAR